MIIFTVLCVIAVLYWIEVLMGSASSTFDGEVGMPSRLEDKVRMKKGEFLGKVVPVILAAMGIPLMMQSLFEGLLLLAASASLLILFHRSGGGVQGGKAV